MGRHEIAQTQLQVLYLGNSAVLGTLRRSMEARGVVTRSRLTPAVDAVIADSSVRSDHPTVRAAAHLSIPVLRPDEAAEHLAVDWMPRLDPGRSESTATRSESTATRPESTATRSGWSFRRS